VPSPARSRRFAPASLPLLLVAALLSMAPGSCRGLDAVLGRFFFIASPGWHALTPETVSFDVVIPDGGDPETLVLELDGAPVVPLSSGFVPPNRVTGELEAAVGGHELAAEIEVEWSLPWFLELLFGPQTRTRRAWSVPFQVVALQDPDTCEFLNDAECLLPYPSSRFLSPAATPTGVRLDFPASGMPPVVVGGILELLSGARSNLDPTPYAQLDGFSPTVQVLMHFPGGADLAASGAPVLVPSNRTFDPDGTGFHSPTVLLDADTGERVAHFLENDSRATGDFADRKVTFLRPSKALLPGHRYIVAVRHLVHEGGDPVEPEPAFAALRDRRPTQIPAIEARRAHFEDLFATLRSHGVPRRSLVLAFDFRVQSVQGLTAQMMSMRDQAFTWLASQAPADVIQVDEEEVVTEPEDCPATPDAPWKIVSGSFEVPLFLETAFPGDAPGTPADPIADEDFLGVLVQDADGTPVQANGGATTHPPFAVAIPCAALLEGPQPKLYVGHGLFGDGPGMVEGVVNGLFAVLPDLRAAGLVSPDTRFDYVVTGTNWSGLSALEVPPLPSSLNFEDPSPEEIQDLIELAGSFIGQIFLDFDEFQALPDRLRHGMLHAVVLARLLDEGAFNALPEFQVPDLSGLPNAGEFAATPGQGVIDPAAETNYFGVSLGGIMGTMFAAVSNDVQRLNVDVPAINFSLLLQRAKPFNPFQDFLGFVEPDPTIQALTLGLIHELWVRGEPAGYAHHITGNTLPPLAGPVEPTNTKQVLATASRFDQQVTNLGAHVLAATLGLPNLEGSFRTGIPDVPDAPGPLPSALVVYDTGVYTPGVHDAFIPPLANRPAAEDDNQCDPHGQRQTIPASLEQLAAFLAPGGMVENFCNGLCDAEGPLEIAGGMAVPCDPNAP
jgi:hypothetical protein